MLILAVILLALGIAAGVLIPNVSDDIIYCVWINNHCINSCQRVLELVPTLIHYSPSPTLKEPGMLGMLLKTQ